MDENRFETARRNATVPLGHMLIEFGTRGIAQITAAADLDFVVIDMEQSGFDIERIADLAAWFAHSRTTPFVRIPDRAPHFIARTLDAGMRGIIVPNVESAADARAIVECAAYPPRGKRGIAIGAAHAGYGVADPHAFLAGANDRISVICQIESAAGLANAAEIAAVAGVSGLWLGHNDLSSSLGIYGAFDHPTFLAALHTIVAAARGAGIAAVAHPANARQFDAWRALGFDAFCWRIDAALYREALCGEIAAVRQKLGSRP